MEPLRVSFEITLYGPDPISPTLLSSCSDRVWLLLMLFKIITSPAPCSLTLPTVIDSHSSSILLTSRVVSNETVRNSTLLPQQPDNLGAKRFITQPNQCFNLFHLLLFPWWWSLASWHLHHLTAYNVKQLGKGRWGRTLRLRFGQPLLPDSCAFVNGAAFPKYDFLIYSFFLISVFISFFALFLNEGWVFQRRKKAIHCWPQKNTSIISYLLSPPCNLAYQSSSGWCCEHLLFPSEKTCPQVPVPVYAR